MMGTHGVSFWLLTGGVAGWLSGLIMRGGGYGWVGDVVFGTLGAIIADWLFGAYPGSVVGGSLRTIVASTIGAVVLIVFARAFNRFV